MNLSIRKKLVVIFVLGLVGLGGIGYLLYTDKFVSGKVPEPYTSDFEYLKAVGAIRSCLNDIELTELRYAFSGEPSYLAACRDSMSRLHENLNRLKSLSTDSINRLRRIEQIEPLIEERIRLTEKVLAVRSERGREAAHALLNSKGGKALSDALGMALSGLEQDGLRASVYQDQVLEKGVKKSVLLIAAGYAAALIVIVLAILVIGRELRRFRHMSRDLQDLKERFRLMSEGLRDTAQIMLGPDGTVSSWGAAAERLHGFCESEILGKHYSLCVPRDEVRLQGPEHCLRIAETEGRYEDTGPRQRKDGSVFPAHTVITPVWGVEEELRGYSIITTDITEQIRTEELLKKLSLTVEQTGDLVLITDAAGKVEYANKAVQQATGYSREMFIAHGIQLLQMGKQDPRLYRTMWTTVLAGRTFHAEVTAISRKDQLIFIDQVVTPLKDAAGNVRHLVFTGSNLTPVKQMRDKLAYLASYDTLTGLPNRDLFTKSLNREITGEAGRKSFVVLAIDIDRFKYLNEIYGLEAGNKVLKQVAESLSVSVNKGDAVCRLGSDEFGIVLHKLTRPGDAILFVKMIMKNVPQIIMSGGQEISVTLAIGIAVYPSDGADALTLMKNADTALAKAKQLGRNRFQFYTSDMNEGISEMVFMERRLSAALRNQEYALAYQPYYHLADKKIAGAEALLRWNNEEFGFVSPAKFIPMLEETGMITDVGNWVFSTACRQIKEWSKGEVGLPISVNISASQFRNEYLADMIQKTVWELGIDPAQLTLEITESIFMKDQEFAVSVLQRLKKIGVSISIDDFGTGYSSLSYLKKFPVDTVKIDQSFVRDVASDPDTTSLVTSIISMAHSLDLKTIAEGVETEEQWKILRLLKCDMGQGFYFSLAVTPKQFEQLVA